VLYGPQVVNLTGTLRGGVAPGSGYRDVGDLLREAVERVTDGFVALSADWHYVFLNRKGAALLGRTPEELVGRHIWTEFPEGVGQPFHRAYETAMREQRPVFLEEHYEPWDRWFENRIYPSPDGISIFFSDITERRRTEQRLRAATERLVEAQQIAQLGSWEWHAGAADITCTDELLRIHGLTPADRPVTLSRLVASLHPEDRRAVRTALERAVDREVIFGFRTRIIRDGGVRQLQVHGRVLRDTDGAVERLAGTTQDITESDEMQETLRATEGRLAAILEHTPSVIYVKAGDDLRYVEANAEFGRLLGRDPRDILGRRDEDFFPPDVVEKLRSIDRRVIEDGRSVAVKEQVPFDGRTRTYLSVKFRLPDPAGGLAVGGISTDITDREEREQALRREMEALELNADLTALNERLKDLDELKSRFLANVSHDLRTPLALIVGRSDQLVAGGRFDAVTQARVDEIRTNALGLAALVDQLLTVASLDAQPAELEIRRLDLDGFVRGVAAAFDGLVLERRLSRRHVGPGPIWVEADPTRLESVVANLVANAVQAAPVGGHVRTSVRLEGETAVIEVADDGPGIPQQLRGAIFERFGLARHDQPLPGGRTGPGLGLSIARDVVLAHGGTVAVADAPEGGALLRVVLPCRAPDGVAVQRGRAERSASATTRSRVSELERRFASRVEPDMKKFSRTDRSARRRPVALVVEDHPDLAQLVADVLGEGCDAVIADNADEALELALAREPDVVITDLMLPGMDGEGLLARLRAAPATATVPVLVLTARTEQPVRERLLANGADDFLVKPFATGELRSRVAALLRRSEVEAELGRANEHLRQSNHDLQAFAAGVAHDLTQPLATADLLAELLEERARDEEGGHLVAQLRAGLGRMRALVVSLRTYAELGGQRLVPEEVDLSELVAEVMRDLGRLRDETGAVVKAGDLPVVTGDRLLLGQLFQNLLSNAIRFRTDEPPRIVVTAVEHEDRWEVSVADNGIGLDPVDAERAFRLFERLESVQQPGSGIGLAICELVARRHGGSIGVEPSEGRGTTFVVTLPAALPAGQAVTI
jgi:PAS domain S-box-containing protein